MSLQLLFWHITALAVSICFAQNTYETFNGTNGVSHVWRSTSDFVPAQASSFGEIRIGYVMSIEFDFVYNGRSCDPNGCTAVENYFRVGFTADNGNNCGGTYARYPSLWLSAATDTLYISISDESGCSSSDELTGLGTIVNGTNYHILISYNTTTAYVSVETTATGDFYSTSWTKDPTDSQYLGLYAPIWFMSNKFGRTEYNVGDATMSNIVIKSDVYTPPPTTAAPTGVPTPAPTNVPTSPTKTPSSSPSLSPTTSSPTTAAPTNPPTTASPTTSPTTGTPTTGHPTTITTDPPTTAFPSTPPTTGIPTSTPSTSPSRVPTDEPSMIPTKSPSAAPSPFPTSEPTIPTPTSMPTTPHPTESPTTGSPSTPPTLSPSDAPTVPTLVPTNQPTEEPTTSKPTSEDPYTYIFYGAIAFVALLLILMAFCCYCKFKPPSGDDHEYHFSIHGQSTGKQKTTMSVPIENLTTNRENIGGHEQVHTGSHTMNGLSYSQSPASEELPPAAMANVNQMMSHPHRPGGGKLYGRDSVTGSATSDEDVLKGAYGGHITAGGDDLFPRDRLRAINDDVAISPMRDEYIKGHRVTAQQRQSSEYTDEDDRDEYYDEEEEDTEQILDEEEYRGRYHRGGRREPDRFEDDHHDHGRGRYDDYDHDRRHRSDRHHHHHRGDHDHGHQTVGPPENDRYPFNRHNVDADEQYIVEMITKDELRRKVDDNLEEMQRHANSHGSSYASNLYQAQEMEQQRMDDIINEIQHDSPHNGAGNYTQAYY